MSKWNGRWGVIELREHKYESSFPTKDEAMKVVNDLNFLIASSVDTEQHAPRYKKYGVVPLTFARLEELKSAEKE